MNKKRTARKSLYGVFSKLVNKPLSARSWMLALALLLSPAVSSSATYAQSTCLNQCQQQLARCMDDSENNPPAQALCQDTFDACAESCMAMTRG